MKHSLKDRLQAIRDHVKLSDDAGGNEQEMRELRSAVLELTSLVEGLLKHR